MDGTSATLEIRVRYPECDPMGYLHHARYFEYFEMGRTELLREHGHAYRDLETAGVFFVVARAQCRFRRPARYDDRLTLITRVARMTTARIDHHYQLHRGATLLCSAETTIASVDRTGRLIPIPGALRRPDDQ